MKETLKEKIEELIWEGKEIEGTSIERAAGYLVSALEIAPWKATEECTYTKQWLFEKFVPYQGTFLEKKWVELTQEGIGKGQAFPVVLGLFYKSVK